MVIFRRHIYIALLSTLLLLFGGMTNEAWAAKVTYHVLTLPLNHEINHTKAEYDGKRLEAIRVIVDNGTEVELPSHFKSPLADNFTYYKAADVTQSVNAEDLYGNNNRKVYTYTISSSASAWAEHSHIESDCHIYVTYTYKADNGIADLTGGTIYNIVISGGFLAVNRGRNNRPAIVPKKYVTAEDLSSEEFVKVDVTGSGITTYWSSGDNKNNRADVESYFHFLFKYEGGDPYNITISSAYNQNTHYIEKNEDDKKFVNKYYKGATLFANSTANSYFASDNHIKYTQVYTESTNVVSESKPGYYHGIGNPVWNSFALLNNSNNTGYVFMGSRMVNNNGVISDPTKSGNNYQYYYLNNASNNNLVYKLQTTANASNNNSADKEMYELKDVNFKVKTPFGNFVTAPVKMSKYSIENDDIKTEDIPTSLDRKYCNFTGKFYSDAALTNEITSYSELTSGSYDVYVGYSVSDLPFTAITPAAEYSDATWKAATWYEMTDEGSTEENGKKIKYDGSNYFKNNGAHGEYEKTSEFAFIGDPYELRVISRSLTSGASPSYVGAAGTPLTGTALTASEDATAGYQWQIPNDGTYDSDKNFNLQLFNGEGHWSWNANHVSEDVTYGTGKTIDITGNAQTITLNISGLTYANGNYITVTAGGDDASQVTATVPTLTSGHGAVRSDGTTTVTATVAASGGGSKSFTLTIQEYNTSEEAIGSATVITISQAAAAYAGNNVEYSTASSTRIKVMELPKCTYTYKIVDKAGNIAAKASASQTIFSPLSVASIPNIIVSPFILDETITFYDTYGGTGRGSLSGEITETPNANHDIFVKYTTTHLDNKPVKLSEDQEFNVKLNGRFIYCVKEGGNVVVKTKESPTSDELASNAYLWKLRARDPYAMLIDNLGAREDLSVTGTETPTIYDDNGGTTTPTRQKGAWVKLAGVLDDAVGLAFDTNRDNAQFFIAKSSINQGIYEVMVATDAVDASTTYYNIGCPDDDVVKIYKNTTYEHGFPHLAFVLNQNVEYTYYLIDKAKHILLEAKSKTPDLALPAEYQSPLVGTYNYYGEENITESGDEYTPTDASIKIDNLEAVYTKTSGDYSSQWTGADSDHKLTANDEADVDTKAKELKSTGDFYFRIGETTTYYHVNVTKRCHDKIYVTYEKNDLVNFDENSPYMLRYLNPHADGYHLEDGGDKLTVGKIKAVYPYCNGDGSLNIYGTAMNEEQMGGGASTRTRWVWYFESDNNDPYHVKIHSYNTISYNSVAHPTYLQTYAVHFNQDANDNDKHIVTCGILPGIASVEPTEYMILGAVGQYKLVTTNEVEGARRTVNTFEQYWKTYDMIKKCVLGIDVKNDANYKDAFSNDESTWVIPDELRDDLQDQLETLGVGRDNWHSFEVIANGKRWNGYNGNGTGTGKVVEKLEHWFQTFEMGDGAFNIESAVIPPVLVLLDRHGWEIMRKPLPNPYTSTEGLEALRAYDSPLVKEYKFYSSATKATGCHKYTVLKKGVEQNQITVNGQHYTSTSLASLPPETAKGVKDNKGAFNDQFVTYTVKDEYEMSYSYAYYEDSGAETETLSKFLVIQNHRFARDNSDADTRDYYMSKPIRQGSAVPDDKGELYDMIVTPSSTYADKEPGDGVIDDRNLWYVRPNLKIDEEMGIIWGTSNNVDDQEPLTEAGTKKRYKTYGMSGFDPYNIQLQNVMNGKYMSTHITKTSLSSGSMVGDYSGGGSNGLSFVDKFTAYTPGTSKGSEGYDHTNIQMSNQTFMAVSDANGNMQLMPRFDHTKRIDVDENAPYLTTLKDPVDHTKATVDNWRSMGKQTTFFVHPNVYEYHIIDHEGREALRYKSGGESVPYIPNHLQSPLATDFKYYKTLLDENSDGTYELSTLDDEITASFAEAGLNDLTNHVYVRYSYWGEADNDHDKILQGKWFTIKLDNKDVKCGDSDAIVPADGTGVSLFKGTPKPDLIDGSTDANRTWQWKFLAAPVDPESEYYGSTVDPYAVQIFSRKANYTTDMTLNPNPMGTGIKVDGTDRFALLSHPNGGYAFAAAGVGLGTYTYSFLNGADMTTSDDPSPVAAKIVAESNVETEANHFTYKSNALSDDSELVLNDDVTHTYTYNVITNDDSGKKLAVSAIQTGAVAAEHNYAPYLPDDIQTPLLKATDYEYYGGADESSGSYTVNANTKLITLLGLYNDEVYVRYKAYDVNNTDYKVPNKRNATGGRDSGSKDAALSIDGSLPYNIIWEGDKMMQTTDNENITSAGSHALDGDTKYVWRFYGNDPYAIQIRHNTGGKFVDGDATLSENATKTYMLLKKDGYEYGILQETGGSTKLTGHGASMTPDTATNPNYFTIFALSVHNLIYRLIIANIDGTVEIPYSETNSPLDDNYVPGSHKLVINGTTQRDLTSQTSGVAGDAYQLGVTINVDGGSSTTYCHDAGAVGIGDVLEVPTVLYRPNCSFYFYIDGIWDNYDSGTKTLSGGNVTLNNLYKGLELDENTPRLMDDADLINKTVRVNIVYKFDKTLATNTGLDFVKSTDENLWYTFETYNGTTPYLAHYTNAWGLQSMEGRETRYTNDYLWTPVGDPYGFKMYNRYMVKNSNGSESVMTASTLTGNTNLKMGVPNGSTIPYGYEVFELLAGNADGYFRIHPVMNNSGDRLYVKRCDTDADINSDGNNDLNYAILSTTPSDWAFGLDMTLLEPYSDRAGYIGGLTSAGKTAYDAADGIIAKQKVVYDDNNIVNFTSGYYRLHSVPGTPGVSPVRYASGYLHKVELTGDDGVHTTGPIPMHFYSKKGVNTTFGTSGLNNGYTVTNATRGDIPVPATEYDPSTVFHLSGGVNASDPDDGTNPRVTMSTQGLYVKGVGGDDTGNAVMSTTTAGDTKFSLIDIGGAVFLITDKLDPLTRKYLHYGQSSNIYDLKYYHNSPTNEARWCIEPADKQGLVITTNNGGDDYYYTTFCAPFDVQLPTDADSKTYNAFICETWQDEGLHTAKVPAVGETYAAGKFVPAGTPVIIRTNDNSGNMKLKIPSNSPSSALSSCVFSGEYLEQLLAVDAAHDVYTLGLPFISEVTKDRDYNTTGNITAPVSDKANSGVGFYINATPNKEHNALQSMWLRNNRYVLHNKIYYRASASPGREVTRGVEFVPVIFDDNEGDPEQDGVVEQRVGDGGVYDLLGRKVATEQQVKDGTWRNMLEPGIYIINGRKFSNTVR